MGLNFQNKPSGQDGVNLEERDYATKTEMENISEPSGIPVGYSWQVTGEGEAGFVASDEGGDAVAVRAYSDSTLNIAHNTFATVPLNSESYDTADMHDNVTNNTRLTCTSAGIYSILGQIEIEGAVGGIRLLYIRLNGTTDIAKILLPAAETPSNSRLEVSAEYELGIGDYVELRVLQNSGDTLSIITGDNSPIFSMHKVSAVTSVLEPDKYSYEVSDTTGPIENASYLTIDGNSDKQRIVSLTKIKANNRYYISIDTENGVTKTDDIGPTNTYLKIDVISDYNDNTSIIDTLYTRLGSQGMSKEFFMYEATEDGYLYTYSSIKTGSDVIVKALKQNPVIGGVLKGSINNGEVISEIAHLATRFISGVFDDDGNLYSTVLANDVSTTEARQSSDHCTLEYSNIMNITNIETTDLAKNGDIFSGYGSEVVTSWSYNPNITYWDETTVKIALDLSIDTQSFLVGTFTKATKTFVIDDFLNIRYDYLGTPKTVSLTRSNRDIIVSDLGLDLYTWEYGGTGNSLVNCPIYKGKNTSGVTTYYTAIHLTTGCSILVQSTDGITWDFMDQIDYAPVGYETAITQEGNLLYLVSRNNPFYLYTYDLSTLSFGEKINLDSNGNMSRPAIINYNGYIYTAFVVSPYPITDGGKLVRSDLLINKYDYDLKLINSVSFVNEFGMVYPVFINNKGACYIGYSEDRRGLNLEQNSDTESVHTATNNAIAKLDLSLI